jgi:hypothetical protein
VTVKERYKKSLLLLGMAVAVSAFGGVEGNAAVDSATTIDAIRRIDAAPQQAVRVDGFRLNTGLGELLLERGVLVPSTPVAGKPVEFAFIGRGRALLDPVEEVERSQLELFTGSPTLDEAFDEAVLVVALDSAVDALAALPSAADHESVSRAADIFDRWRASAERKLLEVDARLLRDGVGDPLAQGFFCASIRGSELGDVLWVIDPLADEQLTVGQFVRPELTTADRKRATRHLQREQRRGKLIGRTLADLGVWDTWVSLSLRGEDGSLTPGSTGVESRHYDLEVSLRGRMLELSGTARIELDVLVDNLRAVTLDLNADMVATRVTDGKGRELDFTQGASELTAILAESAGVGEVVSVAVEYTGRPFDRLRSGAFVQRRPLGWYPHAGLVDRATYSVEISWPKKYELLGSGTVEEVGVARKGMAWQRRSLDVPALGFSFEVGDFRIATGRLGSVTITVAADRLGQEVSRDLAEELLDAVRGPLAYFQSIYGPYPLDELVVVSSPRGFSQGLLGFVTLSTAGIVDWDMWSALLGFEDRRLLIAHEISHQWWGNLVGWRSYRDQWISEAMANYSALLYERNRLRGRVGDAVGPGPTTGWRAALETTTEDGRPLESLGPMVLGVRLNSSLSLAAYDAIVYKKGAVVIDMLARLYGEEQFIEMLAELVRLGSGRAVTTEAFLDVLEALGGVELSWFERQYVLGTGIPEITYDASIRELEGGRWLVEGEAVQQASVVESFRVADPSGEGLDLQRVTTDRLDVTDSVLVVPFQIKLAQVPAGPSSGGTGESFGSRWLAGRLVLEGESSPFRLELDDRPESFWLDRYGEVFGRFFAASRWPRRAGFHAGLDLLAVGDSEAAERVLLEALEKPILTDDEEAVGEDFDLERAALNVDVAIRLALARLYLESDRPAEAEAQIEAARARIPRAQLRLYERRLVPLEARCELLAGNPTTAFRQLKKALGRGRPIESAEAWGLYAIAAHLDGRAREYPEACRGAADRGVDLGPLSCP